MLHERIFTVLVVTALTLAAPSAGRAQEASRAVVLMTLLAGDSVGVLVGPDRVFTPDANLQPLSACGARCAPVRSASACSVPQCPGQGVLFTLEAPISDLSDLPTDRSGFNHAIEQMRADPALASVAWSFGTHPDPAPEPPRWLTSSRRERFVWELGAHGIGGVLGATGVGFVGGEVSAGFRFTWEPHGADDDFLAIILGDVLGLDVRVRALDLLPTQAPASWGVTIGLAPAMGYATRDEVFRLPTFYSVLLPEFGVALRENRDAAWYAGWSLPLSFLVEEHLGVEGRVSVLVVDDWIPGDDVEAIVSFGLGFVAR